MASATLELDDIQGIIARGYGGLPAAAFILLALPTGEEGRAWLAATVEAVTPADQRPESSALHVAFTAEGLRVLGLPDSAADSFPLEFSEGMTARHRQRQLGDTHDSVPDHWHWGGPSTTAVHLVLLLYAANQSTLERLRTSEMTRAEEHGLTVVSLLSTSTELDREPFGFRDGISQPTVDGLARAGDPFNTVRSGEFVLGYENEYGLLTDSPTVAADTDAEGLLPSHPAAPGMRDVGRNGSYLVFRQLEQDVAGFWRHLDAETRSAESGSNAAARELLAAKMVGRWPSGAPLVETPDHDDPTFANTNDFGYHERDEDGLRCPVGAHVRRANPRDSLDPNPGTADSYELNKRHRLLRRGRPYGSRLSQEQAIAGERDDEDERGLHFICIAANIARQFEFVQQTWIGNPKFGGLYEGVDPIMGPRGPEGTTFSIPDHPVRRRVTGLPSFVTVRGGAYFFLPGIRALRYLSALRPQAPDR